MPLEGKKQWRATRNLRINLLKGRVMLLLQTPHFTRLFNHRM